MKLLIALLLVTTQVQFAQAGTCPSEAVVSTEGALRKEVVDKTSDDDTKIVIPGADSADSN